MSVTPETYRVAWDGGEDASLVMRGHLALMEDGRLALWNGFVCPYFAKSDIDAFIAWQATLDDPSHYGRVYWDDGRLMVQPAPASYPDGEPEEVESIDWQGERLYGLGAWALYRIDYTQVKTCPRCGERDLPLGHPGAISRVDNRTEVCSPCGVDEALADYFGRTLAPVSAWPVARRVDDHD